MVGWGGMGCSGVRSGGVWSDGVGRMECCGSGWGGVREAVCWVERLT